MFQEGNTALLSGSNGGSPSGSNSSIPGSSNNGNMQGILSSSNGGIPVRNSSGILGRNNPGILHGTNKVTPSDGRITPCETSDRTEHGSGETTQVTHYLLFSEKTFIFCCTIVFFTITQSWQCWHYCQLCIPIYLQFSSLFITTVVNKCELRNQGVHEDSISRLYAFLD